MNNVKIIFIAVEVAAILGLVFILCNLYISERLEFVEAVLILLLALNAVVFQREQQSIEWDEDSDE